MRIAASLLTSALLATNAFGAQPPTPAVCAMPTAGAAELGNATIGEIVLDRRQIFDTSLPEENKRLFRLANRYHILTRPSTIRSQLLFAPGDTWSQRLADESERLLRGRLYLVEAAVRPVNFRDGIVDVCVTTRDVWTLKPDLSFERAGGENEVYVEFEDRNLLGTGAALSISFSEDNERDSTAVRFADPQVGRSRVAFSAELADFSDGHRRVLAVERPFFAFDTRWSAGSAWVDDERVRPLYDLGEKVLEFGQRRRYIRVSGGRSRGLIDGWARRIVGGLVIDDTDFYRPDTTLAGRVPADRKLVYPYVGIEIIEDEFVEAENTNQIGRTEDLYLGTRVTASLGWSATGLNANREGLVFESSASTGLGHPNKDLWLLDTRLSGRYENDDLQNTVLSARARFYRRQSPKWVFYASIAADTSENLDLDNPLQLGGESGARGYPFGYQAGTSRILATFEQRYFSDWYPFRLVRVGGAVFADVGRTWGTNPVGSGSLGWLSDVGVGLRLASPRGSTGNVLHIDLAFPIDGDDSIDEVQLLVEGRRSF